MNIEVAEQVARLRKEGKSYREIGRILGKSASYCCRLLDVKARKKRKIHDSFYGIKRKYGKRKQKNL